MDTTELSRVASSIIEDIDGIYGEHVLIVYNNEITPIDSVIQCFVSYIPCSWEYARVCAFEIHRNGSMAVMESSYSNCYRVREKLKAIDVRSEIEKQS